MDKIEKVFYINLKHRTDRRVQIENELKEKFLYTMAERYEALLHEIPVYGCQMSHISLWRKMIKNNWNTMMVMEDDAMLQTTRQNIDKYINGFLEDPNAGILSIANSCSEHVNYNCLFERAFNSQTTACYIIKLHAVKELLPYYFKNSSDVFTLKEDDPELSLRLRCKVLDAADSWFEYQAHYTFLIPKEKKIVIQRESYSDIEKRVVFYNL